MSKMTIHFSGLTFAASHPGIAVFLIVPQRWNNKTYRRMGVALVHDDQNAGMIALRRKAKGTTDKISIE